MATAWNLVKALYTVPRNYKVKVIEGDIFAESSHDEMLFFAPEEYQARNIVWMKIKDLAVGDEAQFQEESHSNPGGILLLNRANQQPESGDISHNIADVLKTDDICQP